MDELFRDEPRTPPTRFETDYCPRIVQSRSTQGSSAYMFDSPDPVVSQRSSRSPAYHTPGRALLPKIRNQDLVQEPVSKGRPNRHRKTVSTSVINPVILTPSANAQLSARHVFTDPSGMLMPPGATVPPYGARYGTTVPTITVQSRSRQRSSRSCNVSIPTVDNVTVSPRQPYTTYQETSAYAPTIPAYPLSPTSPIYPAQQYASQYGQLYGTKAEPYSVSGMTSKYAHDSSNQEDSYYYSSTSTCLLQYLTSPTQAINIVSDVEPRSSRLNGVFWWDVRNIRRWSSFSLASLNEVPHLMKLLKTDIPESLTPSSYVKKSHLTPDSEYELAKVIHNIYAPRVNAALKVSQGEKCLSLYPAPNAKREFETGPHLLANYSSDNERTGSGARRARLVGIVKTFDKWNTGMRNEAPHRRVEYLQGLAHLQKCMRDHSCRYGFILTEIELVCVRAGCDEGDNVPYFGFLEVAAPIATKISSASLKPPAPSPLERPRSAQSNQSSDYSGSSRCSSPDPSADNLGPFTATLALYYLLMLSKSVALPGQPSHLLDIGAQGDLSRQRVLAEGRDRWIPEPQQRERREAKRVRGWVMPQDGWHRREGGRPKSSKDRHWHK